MTWTSPEIGTARLTEPPETLRILWRVIARNQEAETRRRLNRRGALVTLPFFLLTCLAVVAFVTQLEWMPK